MTTWPWAPHANNRDAHPIKTPDQASVTAILTATTSTAPHSHTTLRTPHTHVEPSTQRPLGAELAVHGGDLPHLWPVVVRQDQGNAALAIAWASPTTVKQRVDPGTIRPHPRREVEPDPSGQSRRSQRSRWHAVS